MREAPAAGVRGARERSAMANRSLALGPAIRIFRNLLHKKSERCVFRKMEISSHLALILKVVPKVIMFDVARGNSWANYELLPSVQAKISNGPRCVCSSL